ncbi:hypothetical protein GZH47_19875 [Paenibacillus rhizovicinus]|uniref:Uncharacterized protein n=1 Tax=Paenibacillus rhizovicinus TaxID=2704463 RepID=A0A6C0P312_9BACL|nr:hypothetical protein [Paenibacillus rhizovicinus]QHW32845.1 hypothetical protein GZH47_19875 [Paenibacillus rhizovicinus]
MFELHDTFVYVMSICSLVSLACLYLIWAPAAPVINWRTAREMNAKFTRHRLPIGTAQARRQRLTRLTKRKEAPDDDSSPCASLLKKHAHIQQGGFNIWKLIRCKSEFFISTSWSLSLG